MVQGQQQVPVREPGLELGPELQLAWGPEPVQGQAPQQAYTQLVQGTHVGVVVGGEEFDPARASHVAVRAPSPFLGLGLHVASD